MVQIKRGTREDLADVFELVKGLAKYENAEDQVTSKIEDYTNAFDNNLIGIHVAKTKDITVGCTLYYDSFSTWKGKMLYLEDFYVIPEYRKEGIGQLLFGAFLQEAKDRNCAMVKWQVLDWNEPAIKFYNKMGASIEKEWWNGKIIF